MRSDAAERAKRTLSEEEWGELGLRASIYVLRIRRAAGQRASPGRVEGIAGAVLEEFYEGHVRVSVDEDATGQELIAHIIRGLAPTLRARAEEP